MGPVFIVITCAAALLAVFAWRGTQRRARRAAFIDGYAFPARLRHKLRERYPQLTETDAERVIERLRDWFHVARAAAGRQVAMPSQAVDVAWHEFILFTRNYAHFCRQGLGRFLHHTPAEAMRTPTEAQQGIRRAWRLACRHEGIDPRRPQRLPALFALDAELQIPDGFRYALNCAALAGPAAAARDGVTYCGAHVGCGSGGGDGGCSSDSGCSGDGGGCGGGGD